MQTTHVAVLGEQNVAPFTTAMHPASRDGERVARRVASNHERQAANITVAWTTEAFDAIRSKRLIFKSLELDDLLTDTEEVVELEQPQRLRTKLQVHAVEGALVADHHLVTRDVDQRVTWQQVAVASKDGTRVTADQGRRLRGQGKRAGLAAIGA